MEKLHFSYAFPSLASGAGGRPLEADLSSLDGWTVERVGRSTAWECIAVTSAESRGSRTKL